MGAVRGLRQSQRPCCGADRVIRFLTGAGSLVGAVAMAGLAAVLALSWRLSDGPLDLAWTAPSVELATRPAPGQPRFTYAGAQVEWAKGAELGRGLALRFDDVRVLNGQDKRVAGARRVDVSVSLAPLLLGRIRPRAVSITGLEVDVTRDAQGDLRAELGGFDAGNAGGEGRGGDNGGDAAGLLASLARPPGEPGQAAPADAGLIAQLTRVHLDASSLRFRDAASGGRWRFDLGQLDLVRMAGGGVSGTASAAVEHGPVRAALTARAALAPAGGTRIEATIAPVQAAAVQQTLDDGAAILDAAISGSAQLDLSPALQPVAAQLRMEGGAGRLRLAGAMIGFEALLLDAAFGWDQPSWVLPAKLKITTARAVVRPPGAAAPSTLVVSGRLDRPAASPGARMAGSLTATVDRLGFADIASVWPEPLGGHVRPWLTKNVTGGAARDAAITLGFDLKRDPLPGTGLRGLDLRLLTADGSVTGEDVTLYWLKPVQPVERAQAVLTINNPQELTIAVSGARQGAMVVRDGTIRITGLDVKDQFLALTANIAGGVADAVTLLKHPRLQILDKHPLPMRNPGGSFAGRLSVDLPLNEDLEFDAVKIGAHGRLVDLRLGGLVAGRDLERGRVQFDVTSDGMRASGAAVIAGIVADLSVDMDFRAGGAAQVTQKAQASGRATPAQLAAAGLDTGGIIEGGAIGFEARHTERRDGAAELTINANLRDAALELAGWRKPAGQAGEASARVRLDGDRVTGIDQISARGLGLLAEGRVELVDDRPLLLVLDRMTLGLTQGAGLVRFPARPGESIRATLNGSVLDISGELRDTGPRRGVGARQGPGWVADVRFDRVILSSQRGIDGVTAHAEHDGRRVTVLRASSSGTERAEVTIQPQGSGRQVRLTAADGGALLRAADIVDTIGGGQLVLDGTFDDRLPDPPLTGTAVLTGFSVQNAPALGKLLQAVTVYGVVEALSGPGLSFSELILPFRWSGGILDIGEARAFSASLGLTATGRLDTRRGVVDMQGTVVPAYVLNSLLGRIPVLGRLFSAERGGGLVAVNYGLRGPLANPSVSVNPLSALTPGFLRGLFHLLD